MQHFPLQPEQYQSFFPYCHGLAGNNTFSHHFILASFQYLFRPRTPQQLFLIQSCGAKRWRDRWIWKRKLQRLSKICSYKVLCQIILQLARVAHGNEISLMDGLVGRRVLSHKQMLFNNYKCEPEQINLTHLNKQWEKQHARLLPLYDHMYRYV